MIHVPPYVLSAFLNYVTVFRATVAQHHNLTLRSFLVLGCLSAGDRLPFKELSRLLSIPKSNLTSAIDYLEEHGLVKRRQDRKDRRRWFVVLAPKGRQTIQNIQAEEGRLFESALQHLSEAEQEVFLNGTRAMVKELVKPRPQCSQHIGARRQSYAKNIKEVEPHEALGESGLVDHLSGRNP